MISASSYRLHVMQSAQRARADGFHGFAAGLIALLPAERPNYGRTTITDADRQAFANVEAPDVSPTLDR